MNFPAISSLEPIFRDSFIADSVTYEIILPITWRCIKVIIYVCLFSEIYEIWDSEDR